MAKNIIVEQFRFLQQNKVRAVSLALICFCSIFTLFAYRFRHLSGFLFKAPGEKVNVIFMVSDGFGPASEVFARTFYQHIHYGSIDNSDVPPTGNLPILPLDTIMVGQSRTRSTSSWITDSAAGATAFSCARKSYNGAIAVNDTFTPCATILEAAKKEGYATGIVVTSSVTDATPAAFSSHVTFRWYEDLIAEHQIGHTPLGRTVDLLFGGGYCQFVPSSQAGGCRKDEKNLLEEAEKFGFKKILKSREDFDNLPNDSKLPVLGLFSPHHMPYEIDRTETPSLKDMTVKALDILKKSTAQSEKGFFMLVEGSRIDHAAHDNDAAAHAKEILAYQETIAAVKKFVVENPGTVMISVSDHETGGLDLGVQLTSDYPDYLWYPEVIRKVSNSTSALANDILSVALCKRKDYIRNVILPVYLGVEDFTEDDVQYLGHKSRNYLELVWFLGNLVSRRARIGWSTHGHTGVDVNLYAYAGEKMNNVVNPLRGNRENTEIGRFMNDYLKISPDTFYEINSILEESNKKGDFRTYPKGSTPVPQEYRSLGSSSYHSAILRNFRN